MNADFVSDIVREAFIVTVRLCWPSLTVALVVGLAVGLFQALTSVQESTLTFVPKAAAMFGVLWVGLDGSAAVLGDFFHGTVLTAVARI